MMHVKDEAIWLASKADLSAQGPAGIALNQFVEDWCDRAEWDMVENGSSPVHALYNALPAAETKHGGAVHPNRLIQSLLVILAVWDWARSDINKLWTSEHDPEPHSAILLKGLSPVEQRIVSHFAALEAGLLEESADITETPAGADHD